MAAIKQLIVSVDTEEEGLWGGGYRVSGNTTANLRGLPRFQAECDRWCAPPTYLIDAPVLEDREAIENLSRWQQAGLCEVGAHCHPWCNPPIESRRITARESYLCNLDPELQHRKLQWLTDRIADAVGRTPTAYRAGRYGFDRTSAEVLSDLGYKVDSSVLPMHDYRAQGGPDFRAAKRSPYRFFADADRRTLIEVPVTVGFTRPGYELRRELWQRLRSPRWKRLRIAGAADRLGLIRRVKLSPEGTRLADLRKLIDTCITEGANTLVLMLHSSSLVAGCSPYAANSEQLEKLYQRLNGAIRHAIAEHGFHPATLTQVSESLFPDGAPAS